MRILRLLLVGVVLTLFVAAPSQAGPDNGAVITKGSDTIWWFFWPTDGSPLISLHSTDPEYWKWAFCEETPPDDLEGWMLLDYLARDLPPGKSNFWAKGPLFTRVYNATPPAVFDMAWACSLVKEELGPMIAEGIADLHFSENNLCHWGPGNNPWQVQVVGNLAAPSCPSGIAHFENAGKAILTPDAVVIDCTVQDPSDIRWVVDRGPELKCIGRK